nr:hypothetical protein [Secundilactobacillus paracollinoides]
MTKNMWREISHGKGRFIAIILIILLGVQIFVGIKAAGPTLNDSADKTVKDAKLSDVQAFSTTGFTHKDVQLAEKVLVRRLSWLSLRMLSVAKTRPLWRCTVTPRTRATTNCPFAQAHATKRARNRFR